MLKIKVIRSIYDTFETIVIAVSISAILYITTIIPNQVSGSSMEPNLHNNDLIFTNKVIQWLGPTWLGDKLDYEYKRGDIIVFNIPGDSLVKRIIATEGDTITIENNDVLVNGSIIDEKYIPITTRTQIIGVTNTLFKEGEIITIPKDHYFVMGDNRQNSKDSRFSTIGLISRKDIQGRAFFRFWPLDDFGMIHRGVYEELQNEL